MAKGPWESRVGKLLKHPDDFAWSYKPPDTKFYGGQTRIDWIACDRAGRFWLTEVKQLPTDRKSINLRTEVSAGQRDALLAVSQTTVGLALLMVGQGDILYIFDWERVLWQWKARNDLNQRRPTEQRAEPLPSLLPLSTAPLAIEWTGPTAWEQFRLLPEIERLWGVGIDVDMAQTLIRPAKPSRKPASSPSISKLVASIHTDESTLRLVR